MSRLIREEDLTTQAVKYRLIVDNGASICSEIDEIIKTSNPDCLYIDINELTDKEKYDFIDTLNPQFFPRCILSVDANNLRRSLLETHNNIADITADSEGLLLIPGENRTPDLLEKFDVLKQNFSLKEKTYEMEIIESLVAKTGNENQKYQEIHSQYESLKASNIGGRDLDLEARYLDLMEKYKQSLERLTKLRKSKLGRMQLAYWNRKAR